jgi:tetratricopeptide (TPR) repeat protein
MRFTYSRSTNDKIACMRKSPGLYVWTSLGIVVLISGLVYFVPPVRNRLEWRWEMAKVYARGLVDPIQAMPTAIPETPLAAVLTPTPSPLPTRTPQPSPTVLLTPTPVPSPTPLPGSILLPPPKWEEQDINNCGPAALTMYLRFYGWEGDQETITQVIKPYREDRNVNVEELAYFVRTHAGWLNIQYRVGGDVELLKQILAAGVPVMIEESFYFEEPFWTGDDLWAAHYQLITGYDEATQTFTGQDSFRGPDQKIPYKTLDEYWQAFNRVYILVYLPGQEATLKSILGEEWDPDTNRQHALETAQAETQSDPKNAYAWFNLGSNLTYFERYIEATDAYDQARALGLPQRMLRYQFGPFISYFHTGQIEELITLTEYAMKVTPSAEEALLWHGWAMYRKGKISEAIENFEQALAKNPLYQDAEYALDFARTNR